jgi:hypothetical protein
MGVRNYMRKRQIRGLEKERESIIAVRELDSLREIVERDTAINFDTHLRDLNDLERQVVIEERLKKLKVKGLK